MAQTVKNLPAMQEMQVLSLGREDSPGEENGNPLQYSCLENSMDRGVWWATVHGVAKSLTGLSDYHFHFSLRESLLIKDTIPQTLYKLLFSVEAEMQNAEIVQFLEVADLL